VKKVVDPSKLRNSDYIPQQMPKRGRPLNEEKVIF
jgi:hypothetical protein